MLIGVEWTMNVALPLGFWGTSMRGKEEHEVNLVLRS